MFLHPVRVLAADIHRCVGDQKKQRIGRVGVSLARVFGAQDDRPSVKLRCSAIEWGSLSHPVACSFGTTNFRQVSASVGIPGHHTGSARAGKVKTGGLAEDREQAGLRERLQLQQLIMLPGINQNPLNQGGFIACWIRQGP